MPKQPKPITHLPPYRSASQPPGTCVKIYPKKNELRMRPRERNELRRGLISISIYLPLSMTNRIGPREKNATSATPILFLAFAFALCGSIACDLTFMSMMATLRLTRRA